MSGLTLSLGGLTLGGQGAVTPPLLSAGSTYGWVGDGLVANGAGVGHGPNNMQEMFQLVMGGRVQPVAVPNLGRSGSRMKTSNAGQNQYAWVYPYAIDALAAQTPDLFIIGPMGHNDGVLSTDPGSNTASGSTTSTVLQDWYDSVAYAYQKFLAYAGTSRTKFFCVVGSTPSTITGETTVDGGQTDDRRTRVWAAQEAYVNALKASDNRVGFGDVSALIPPASYSADSGSSYTHIDERGGIAYTNVVKAAVDPYVESKTLDEIMDMIAAGTYPLMGGSNLDSDSGLAGTAGTITGSQGMTGSIATSKTISNTTGATGITVGQTSTSGGRTKTVVTLAGTASGAGKVQIIDTSNVSISATRGQYAMSGAIVRWPAGVFNMGSDLNGGNYSLFIGGGQTIGNNALVGAGTAEARVGLMMTTPFALFSGSYNSKRAFSAYYRSGASLTGTIEFERPFAYLVSERTKHAPTYLGGLVDANNALFMGTNQRLRPTGTISQASGGTITVEPGTWTPRGLTESDFATRRIYKGNSGNTAVGSGTLLATLTGSTWAQSFAAATVTTGDLIYVEVDVSNGIGGTVTVRSSSTVTAT